MNNNYLFIAVLYFLVVTLSSTDNFNPKKNFNIKPDVSNKSEMSIFDFTYKTVLINGIWWIKVYDDRGALIDQYPAE